MIYDKEPSDPIMSIVIKNLKQTCPPDQYTPYLKECYKCWNDITTCLEKERLNNKISILDRKSVV